MARERRREREKEGERERETDSNDDSGIVPPNGPLMIGCETQ